MITIISGTNRVHNKTKKISNIYAHWLAEKNIDYKLYSLEDLPMDFLLASKLAKHDASPEFLSVQREYIFPADKFIFILPEYNGSIPGILKLFLDSCEIEQAFYGKKACLTGVSSGRAGNLRGLDHLTNILNYLQIQVYHNKLPISRIYDELDNDGKLLKPRTRKEIEAQLNGFIDY